MFDFGRGDAVPLVKKVGGRRSPAFPLENITGFEAYVNPTETTFEIQNISVVEIKSEISRIKTSKATGHDRISPKPLKDSVEVVAEFLTTIFNKSIEKGVFPDDLKIAYT